MTTSSPTFKEDGRIKQLAQRGLFNCLFRRNLVQKWCRTADQFVESPISTAEAMPNMGLPAAQAMAAAGASPVPWRLRWWNMSQIEPSNQSEMSSILFFHIMRGNLFHHVSCVFPWSTPMFSMLRAQRAMLLRRCFRWCSRWAWHQAMWTHPKKELGVCGGQVDLACIHQVDPSCGIPYHTQDLVTSEIVETSAASNNCFRKPALWCFMITILTCQRRPDLQEQWKRNKMLS